MTTHNDDNEPTDKAKRPAPVTPELRARMKALAAEGLGRNAIAREVGIDGATVTKWAKRDGYTFDREATAIAVRARQIDLAVIREQLARKFLLAADDALEALAGPVKVGQFGGKDNTWNETLLDEPTFDHRKTLVATAQAAAKSGLELLAVDAANGSVSARGILLEFRDALTAGLAAIPPGEQVDPTLSPEQPVGT